MPDNGVPTKPCWYDLFIVGSLILGVLHRGKRRLVALSYWVDQPLLNLVATADGFMVERPLLDRFVSFLDKHTSTLW